MNNLNEFGNLPFLLKKKIFNEYHHAGLLGNISDFSKRYGLRECTIIEIITSPHLYRDDTHDKMEGTEKGLSVEGDITEEDKKLVEKGFILNEGMKYDTDKPRWDLLPLNLVEKLVDVLTLGAKKYTDNNWQKVDKAKERYLAALLRHITAYQKGEKLDPETGLSHLSHAGCNLMFLLHFEEKAENK